MFVIGATAKLQKEINREIKNYEDYVDIIPLNKWICNVFKVSRYKCVIFMNVETRYCVILFRLRKKEFTQIETLFKEQLAQNLKNDGVNEIIIKKYFENFNEITYTKTYSRSILGSIKENIYFSECKFAEELGIDHPDMQYLNHFLNHDMIHLPTKGKRPSEFMIEQLKLLYN
ncbi:DUF6933 domain-containing protein [Haloplasma contractile]|uniref:DUF6933 domain-containing protein n=1 Tax=Haloplasma contractile SSD-17B TaxID=1033810 RepID=U2DUN3_9MOLU|nr:hypothetical protein [Haloplasma contractile]ERJ12117.1 hypothetical protein HLPCO_001644 [Haloplasma contractile SSD-17B]